MFAIDWHTANSLSFRLQDELNLTSFGFKDAIDSFKGTVNASSLLGSKLS